jgi:hypothetical protein
MSFTYTEAHVCEGYDYTKLWWMASVAGGALVGGLVGGRLGLLYGFSVVARGCEGRAASNNLCWLSGIFTVPGFTAIGAMIGVLVSTVVVIVILARVNSRPKA